VLIPVLIALAIALTIGLTLLAVSRRGQTVPTPFSADGDTPLWSTSEHSDALESEGTPTR
jgi:hypothetical protein